MTYDDPDVEQLQWLLVMLKPPTIKPSAAEIDRCLETVARIYRRLHPEQVTLELTVGENCMAGDIPGNRCAVRRGAALVAVVPAPRDCRSRLRQGRADHVAPSH